MGKIKQGILGGFRGKVGTVIGASWNGISYMRGIAQSVRNANTAAQQTQRGFFRELLDLVGQFSNEQLESLFPSTPKGMTRRNMLLQQFADGKVIDGDTKTVDLTEVKTVGNAPTAELPAVTVTAAGENLTISWNGDTDARTAAAAEYPTVFVANTTKKRVFLVNSTTALGATGEASFNVGLSAYGEATDTFSGFMLLNGSKIALVGFGTMAVTKRPARPPKKNA